MTTNRLTGYMAKRDPGTPEIGKFDLREVDDYQSVTAFFVSADNLRSFLSLSELGGPTDVILGNMLDLRVGDVSVLDPDGTLRDDLTMYISEVVYNDGGQKSLIELGIYETDGDTGWFFTLAGDEPSYGLDGARDVREYDDALVRLDTPDGVYAPGSQIFLDSLATTFTTDSDFYAGTPLNDVVNLGIGNDELLGGDGHDELYGDEGIDKLYGENGNDTLSGGSNDDRLTGGNGNDLLYGDNGGDTLIGGNGDDQLYGDLGRDLLDGGAGNDTINGGNSNDELSGGTGAVNAGPLNKPLLNFGPGAAAGGWSNQDSTPRLLGDINGDGAADIVGFGGPWTFSSLNNGDGTFRPNPGQFWAIQNFARNQGWKSQDSQTRLIGDVDGDGKDDIIGFGFNAGFASFSVGNGKFEGFTRAIGNFANAQGWYSDDKTPRLMADVNGDGVDDILGFGFRGTLVSLGNGDGTYGAAKWGLYNFGQDQGWTTNSAFLRLAGDVDGDGLEDIVGFGNKATFVALSNGDGTFAAAKKATDDLSAAKGWGDNDATPRAIGDVNGDGLADIIGFGGRNTFAALSRGDGTFGPIEVLTEDFSRDAGWSSQNILPRTVADLDGDGDTDLIGFSTSGVLTRMVSPETDTFVFASGDDDDVISDFDVLDVLDMRATDLTAAAALAAARQVGANVEIAYEDGSITLENFSLSDLSLDNFL